MKKATFTIIILLLFGFELMCQDTGDLKLLKVVIHYDTDKFSDNPYKKINTNFLGDSTFIRCYYNEKEVKSINYNKWMLINGFLIFRSAQTNSKLFPTGDIKTPKEIKHDYILLVDFNWITTINNDTIWFPNIKQRPANVDFLEEPSIEKNLNYVSELFDKKLKGGKEMNREISQYFDKFDKEYFGLVYLFKRW